MVLKKSIPDKVLVKTNMREDPNYNTFLHADLDNYKGKWIIIFNDSIIASGENIQELIEEAKRKYPNKKFMLAKVPEEGTMIY